MRLCIMRNVSEFLDIMFCGNSDVLYCDVCDIVVSTAQRFHVTQHIETEIHKENKQRKRLTKFNKLYSFY